MTKTKKIRILFKNQGKLQEFEHRNTSHDNSQCVELCAAFDASAMFSKRVPSDGIILTGAKFFV